MDAESSKHQIIEFVVPYATRVNIKEIEKNGKHQDLARELKKLCYMTIEFL